MSAVFEFGAPRAAIGTFPYPHRTLEEIMLAPCHRQLPADFATHAIRESNRELAKRYTASTNTVRSWRVASGVHGDPSLYKSAGPAPLPVPDDFATVALTMTCADLETCYGVSKRTVQRWLRRAQIDKRRAPASTRKPDKAFVPTLHRPHFTPPPVNRDWSEAGQAATHLQHYGMIYRCDERGRANPDGDFWRRGSAVLSAEEVMQRATRLGWQPMSAAA